MWSTFQGNYSIFSVLFRLNMGTRTVSNQYLSVGDHIECFKVVKMFKMIENWVIFNACFDTFRAPQ